MIDGLVRIPLRVFADERGWFMETFNEPRFHQALVELGQPIPRPFVQDNHSCSKAGVLRFTEALAEELKDRGVTVNAVLPSIIDTPGNRADMPKADFNRWVTPQALSRVVAFLLSDDAAAITGACLPVTGRV